MLCFIILFSHCIVHFPIPVLPFSCRVTFWSSWAELHMEWLQYWNAWPELPMTSVSWGESDRFPLFLWARSLSAGTGGEWGTSVVEDTFPWFSVSLFSVVPSSLVASLSLLLPSCTFFSACSLLRVISSSNSFCILSLCSWILLSSLSSSFLSLSFLSFSIFFFTWSCSRRSSSYFLLISHGSGLWSPFWLGWGTCSHNTDTFNSAEKILYKIVNLKFICWRLSQLPPVNFRLFFLCLSLSLVCDLLFWGGNFNIYQQNDLKGRNYFLCWTTK